MSGETPKCLETSASKGPLSRLWKFTHLLGRALWFSIKIGIYLCVAYSVVFTLTLTGLGIWAWNESQNIIAQVQVLKEEHPRYSAFMKPFVRIENGDSVTNLKHNFVPMSQISEHLQKAVIAAEDDMFYLHPGFNLEAMLLALQKNHKHGRQAYGASTLSQQLAKNLFLSTEKTWSRKGKEAIYTLMLEKYLGKERILELYLNYAQWGSDIFGCEAAAQSYYKIPCSELNLRQSVNLAAMLAAPNRIGNPDAKGDKLASVRRRMIYDNLYYAGHLNISEYSKYTSFGKPAPKDSLDPIVPDSSAAGVPDSLGPANAILESLPTATSSSASPSP